MPAPALIGIPWLATIIGSALAGIVTFLARIMTKKLAIVAVAIAVAVVAVTAF